MPDLLRLLDERGLVLTRVNTRRTSLEDLFLALTGRRWPAEEPALSGAECKRPR